MRRADGVSLPLAGSRLGQSRLVASREVDLVSGFPNLLFERQSFGIVFMGYGCRSRCHRL